MRILGVDPGSVRTGFGLIEAQGHKVRYLASGHLNLGSGAMPQRLARIYGGIAGVIEEHRPDVAAIESVFMSQNANSAIKLGQARGAAIAAVAVAQVPVREYTPASMKEAVCGNGRATKDQVAFMVRHLLKLRQPLQADEADALALAVCHAFVGPVRDRLARA